VVHAVVYQNQDAKQDAKQDHSADLLIESMKLP